MSMVRYIERDSTLEMTEIGNSLSSKKDKVRLRFDPDQFNIAFPFSPKIFFTVRGSENFHIYLWIAKDLGWTQDWLVWAMFFGSCAVAWLLVLLYHAVKSGCHEEVYMLIPLTLWLFGNYWWMYGEVVNNDDAINAPETNHMFVAAFAWLALYHFILKPFRILKPDAIMTEKYRAAGLVSRFSYFENWRQYEHAHTLFWLGKDFSWNSLNPYLWVFFLIPTVLIAVDFIWTSWKSKWMMIDCAHYVAQLMWVFGNMVWALGEIFTAPLNGDDDVPYLMWYSTPQSRVDARWYASWVLLIAYVPIVLLYIVWLPLTCMGVLKNHSIYDTNPDLRESMQETDGTYRQHPESFGVSATKSDDGILEESKEVTPDSEGIRSSQRLNSTASDVEIVSTNQSVTSNPINIGDKERL